jgi:hypothetical protein
MSDHRIIRVADCVRRPDGSLRFVAISSIGRVNNCLARRSAKGWEIFGPGFRDGDGRWIQQVAFAAEARREIIAALTREIAEVAA